MRVKKYVYSKGSVLVEVNARRTGGTYVHEFLTRKYGRDYINQVTALSQNSLKTRHLTFDALEESLSELLYPINGEEKGIIVLLTSSLSQGKFGYVVLGESIAAVTALRQQMIERVQE